MNYENFFWGDSILNKIEIVYDKIVLYVYNDALQKEVHIECSKCAGITEVISWDEVIIENIFVNEADNQTNEMIGKIKQLYGLCFYDSEKSIDNKFYELRVVLINNISFSIICQKIEFKG